MKLLVIWLMVGISEAILQDVLHLLDPPHDCSNCQPEQVHIAFGEKSNDIAVTWSTFNYTQESVVEYGPVGMDQRATGRASLFVDGGLERRRQWIHTVTLRDLQFDTRYGYRVGSKSGWSEELSFKTTPQGKNWPLNWAIYGDMGTVNANALPYLQDEVERGHFDVIFHIGDFAYDMDSNGARVGDQFMRQIQPLAAGVPYMTCPGNHEQAYNFSNYAARFKMPGPDSSLFYSFDLGPVHFILISTEVYYFLLYGIDCGLMGNQFKWLQSDLEKANLPENREKHPWIILSGHRPMYCSNAWDIDCPIQYTQRGPLGLNGRNVHDLLSWDKGRCTYCSDTHDVKQCAHELTRVGILGMYGLEPLLNQYGVDVAIWAHEHSYERTWPLYDNQVYNGSTAQPYVNPRAPVHIVTGSAGCKEKTDSFTINHPHWSAFRSSDYGYTRCTAYNDTHLHCEQVNCIHCQEYICSHVRGCCECLLSDTSGGWAAASFRVSTSRTELANPPAKRGVGGPTGRCHRLVMDREGKAEI